MVFTSDRPVSELMNLPDRLINRFERGLNVDLQPPTYETRIAIVTQKVEERGLSLEHGIVELICRQYPLQRPRPGEGRSPSWRPIPN